MLGSAPAQTLVYAKCNGFYFSASLLTCLRNISRKVGSPILHTAVTIEQWHSQVCRSLFRGDAGVATDGSRLTHGHAVMHAPSIQKPTLKCKQAEVWPAVQAHNAAVVAAVVHDGFQRCGLRIPHSSSSRGSRRGSGEGSEGGDANVETSTEPAPEPALVLAARFGNLLTAKVLLDAGVDVGITDVGGQTAFHVSAARGYERVLVALLEAAAAQGKIAAVLFKYKDEHGRLASDLALLQTGKCLLSTLATVCRLAQNDGDIVCASVNPANVVSFHAACTNDGDLKSGGRDGDGPSAAVNAASTEEAMKSSARPVAASKFGWRRYAQGVVPRLLSPKNNATRALPPDAIHEGAISPEDFLRLHQYVISTCVQHIFTRKLAPRTFCARVYVRARVYMCVYVCVRVFWCMFVSCIPMVTCLWGSAASYCLKGLLLGLGCLKALHWIGMRCTSGRQTISREWQQMRWFPQATFLTQARMVGMVQQSRWPSFL